MTRYIRILSFTFFCIFFFSSDTPAAPLTELWNHGEMEGNLSPICIADIDGDGVDDILCLKYEQDVMADTNTTSFKLVKGDTFTTLYDWITPPGNISRILGPYDIDQNDSYEIIAITATTLASNQYQVKIIIYNALNGTQLWESSVFSITSSLPPIYPLFSAFPADLIGTSDYEWVINFNETNPSTEEETGKVKVYSKDAGGVGFTQLLWEQSYSGGMVHTNDTHYDFERDGKLNLTVNFNPQEGSTENGSIISYQPSGLSSFNELVRFESSQPGNDLCMIATFSSLLEMYPTKVDKGITTGNFLITESWQASGEYKNILHAYRADAPYTKIGTYTYDGASLTIAPNDCDGDGWDELAIKYYDLEEHTSNVTVNSVQGGNFSLSKIWETGVVSGNQLIQSHWDLNGDNKVDIGIQWVPLDSDTTSYATLTFYQKSGSSFTQLHQFTASFPGDTYLDPIEASDQQVSGPTEYLNVPVDLDCITGGNLAITNTYERYTYTPTPQYEQDGKITVYNIPSETVSWESSNFNYYLNGVYIVNLRSFPSNDFLISAYKSELSMSGFDILGNVYVYGCGQSTDTTTTTTVGPTSTTTTIGPTTTTTTVELCPTEELYGEYSEETALLRYFRDTVLSTTPEGQEIIRLYYQLSPVVVEMVTSNENARETVKGIIEEVLALIKSEVE